MPFDYWKNEIKLYQTDLSSFKLVKSITSHSCNKCRKNIPKGSYVYGTYYTRICIDCAEEFFDNSINKLKFYIKLIQKSKKNLIKNKNKYKENNVVANI